jgi:tetratricopeptide (TPR) repeat protein
MCALEYQKHEAILTNRAASYIQLRKYKEALFDCEQALYCNKTFVKAHQRAYKCYLSQGYLEKALESLNMAKVLGDGTAQPLI